MFGWPSLVLNGLLIQGAWWVAGHGLRQVSGLARILACAVIAWTWMTLGMELLGNLGLLTLAPLVIWAGIAFLTGLVLKLARPLGSTDPDQTGPSPLRYHWESLFALAVLLWAAIVTGMESLFYAVKVYSDGPIYHLYFALRWWQAGRLFLIASPFAENAAPYFPANGDLWFTWLIVGWGSDRLARIGQAPFLVLACLAMFGCSRILGASRNSATIASAWFASSAALLYYTFEPMVDTIFVAGYCLAIYFFLRFAREGDRENALVLGGLAAGLALGTKPVGVVFIPPLILMAFWVIWRRTRSLQGTLSLVVLVLLSVLSTSGYWFGRNLVLTGNPLYPLQVDVGGMTLLPGWYGPGAMQTSIYYLPITDWRSLVDILVVVMDPRLLPFWLAALGGVWSLGIGKRSDQDSWVWACSLWAVLNIALFWFCIPYRTQHRFMLQGLGLASVPLARLLDRRRWLGIVAAFLLALHLLTPQTWPITGGDSAIPWDLSAQIPNALDPAISLLSRLRLLEQASGNFSEFLRLGSILVMGCVSFLFVWTWFRDQSRFGWISTWAVTLGAIATLQAAGFLEVSLLGNDPRTLFFPSFAEFQKGWNSLDACSDPAGTRVAYAGTTYPYYLMCVGHRNQVQYINVDHHREWLLHDYHRQARDEGRGVWPNCRPGWDRLSPDFQAWLANLLAAKIDLLVVTRVYRSVGEHYIADAEGFPIERQWADSHPRLFEPLYGVQEHDPMFRLYRFRPSASTRPSPRDRSAGSRPVLQRRRPGESLEP